VKSLSAKRQALRLALSLFLYKEISSNKAVIEELSFVYLNNSTSIGEEVYLGLFSSLL